MPRQRAHAQPDAAVPPLPADELAAYLRAHHRSIMRGVDAGPATTATLCRAVQRLARAAVRVQSLAAEASLAGVLLDPGEVLDALATR